MMAEAGRDALWKAEGRLQPNLAKEEGGCRDRRGGRAKWRRTRGGREKSYQFFFRTFSLFRSRDYWHTDHLLTRTVADGKKHAPASVAGMAGGRRRKEAVPWSAGAAADPVPPHVPAPRTCPCLAVAAGRRLVAR
jgi:hypothetical protein